MKKRIAMIAAAAALTGALLIGGTLAYLTSAPEQKVNTFTVGAALTGELKEPLFDGKNFTNPDNLVEIPEKEEELGENLALNFVPGRVIPKDPAVANTSSSTSAWVAVKLQYTTGGDNATGLTAEAIEKFATIDWNTKAWEFNDDKTVAYYNAELAAGGKTPTLFNKVTINTNAGETEENQMQSFEILINAYLIQAEGFTDAKDAMAKTFEK